MDDNRDSLPELHIVKESFIGDIDPAAALEILPQKIADRKKVITSIALDLSVLDESPHCDPNEREAVAKNLEAQKNFLSIYEKRLAAIHRAIAGE